MTDFLDKFTKVHRLPPTFKAARSDARRRNRETAQAASARMPAQPQSASPRPLPYEDSMYIMRHGKKAWRAWTAAQQLVAPTSIPAEFADPKEQAAFAAVYRGRLHLLRIPVASA